MNAKKIEIKINKLRNFKVYDYSSISDDLQVNRDSIAVKISRESKKGKIVKIGRGKFYKRDKALEINRVNFNNPSDKSALRYNEIKPSKYPIFLHLFWSNHNKLIPLDNFIARIIKEDIVSYLAHLRILFGDRKVIEVYLNNIYQSERKENFEEFFKI